MADTSSEVGRITRRAGVVAVFTMLSRIFGAVRDIILFHFFGASAATDAFFIAFTIPNVFRRLVAEGALTIAFIPVYSQTREREGEQAARRFAGAVLTLLLVFVGLLVLLGVLASGALVLAFASGFAADPEQLALATVLTRWMFPYLFFISLVALAMGLLNSHKHFATPAAAPVLLNLAIISGALASDAFDPPILGLAAGVLAGGLAQLVLQLPVLIKRGLLPRPSLDFKQPAIAKLGRMMLPAVFGLAVYQINIIVLRQLASYLPAGHISYYYNANRLTELAMGVFAIAIATAALPSLSDQIARGDHDGMLDTFARSFALTNYVTLPATAGLIALAMPVVSTLYLHGQFGVDDARQTAGTLLTFAPSLLMVAAVRVVAQTFFALGDTRTPTEVAAVVLFLNTAVGMILVGPYGVRGLAATLSITSACQAAMLLWLLRRKLGQIRLGLVATAALKQGLAALVMAAVVFALAQRGDWSLGPSALFNVFWLLLCVAVGVAVYGLITWLLHCPEPHLLIQAARRRRQRQKRR